MSYGISDRQRDFIEALCKQLHVSWDTALAGCPAFALDPEFAAHAMIEDLSREQASAMIEWLIQIRDGKEPVPAPPGQTSMFGADR